MISEVDSVYDACKGDPKKANCIAWKKFIGAVLSGEAMKKLESPVFSCGLQIDVGLERTPPSATISSSMPQSSFDTDHEKTLLKNASRAQSLKEFQEKFNIKITDTFIITPNGRRITTREYETADETRREALMKELGGLSLSEFYDIHQFQEAIFRDKNNLTEDVDNAYHYDENNDTFKASPYKNSRFTEDCCWNIKNQYILCPCRQD